MRGGDGIQGGVKSGHSGSGPALADRNQSPAHSYRDRLSRDTVRKYVAAAKGEGVSQRGPAPTEEQLSRLAAVGRSGPRTAATPAEDLLAPWSDQIYRWLNADHLQLTRILELLLERGCEVSYTSLRRFIQRRNWRRRKPVTVRMEDTAPERWWSWTSAGWA